jgi:hypothetical protein
MRNTQLLVFCWAELVGCKQRESWRKNGAGGWRSPDAADPQAEAPVRQRSWPARVHELVNGAHMP